MALVRVLAQPAPGIPPTTAVTVAPAAIPLAGASTATSAPDLPAVILTMAGVALAAIVAWLLNVNVWDKAAQAAGVAATGFSVFAFLYVIAQAEERALEPVSMFLLGTAGAEQDRDTKLANAQNAPQVSTISAAAEAQAKLDSLRANRALVFWAIATVVALFASAYLKLYFFHIIGLSGVPKFVEILVTGLVIGAGTKPLHDLITRIEKAKEKAQDPTS